MTICVENGPPIRRLAVVVLALAAFVLGCPGFGSEERAGVGCDDTPTWETCVAQILEENCVRCHGDTPTNSAPGTFRLDRYGDEGGKPGAFALRDRIVFRTTSAANPMPPAPDPRLAESDQQALERWLELGAPRAPEDVGGDADAGDVGVDDASDASTFECPDEPTWENCIEELLDEHCVECHSVPPANGAPPGFRLDQYDGEGSNLGAFGMRERILARAVDSPSFPMPPPPREMLSEAEQEAVHDWVMAGGPRSNVEPDAGSDGGAEDADDDTSDTGDDASDTGGADTPDTGEDDADAGVDARDAADGEDDGGGDDVGSDAAADAADAAADASEPVPTCEVEECETLDEIHSEIFLVSCALVGCHVASAPALGLDLDTRDGLRDRLVEDAVESELLIVEPFDREASYLYRKVAGTHAEVGCCQRMPRGGVLPEADIERIGAWIDFGAPE